MTQLLAGQPKVTDLRGSAAPPRGSAVLEDPTGQRRRRLRLFGRMVAIVLTLWLVALVLGGIGLNPVPGIPFSTALRPSRPPAAEKLPAPAPPTASDLQPALPVTSNVASARRPSGIAPIETPRGATVPARARKRAAAPSPRSVTVHTMTPNAQGPAQPVAPTSPATTTPHPNNGRHTGSTTGTTTSSTGTTTSPGSSGSAPGRTGTTPRSTHAPAATTG